MPMGSDTTGDKKPSPIDIHVGKRMRARRIELGMSQEKLAEALGLTFQQVQKYEKATNRMGASRLYAVAKALQVTVTYFYEGINPITGELNGGGTPHFVGEMQQEGLIGASPADEKEALQLIRAFGQLQPDQRAHMLALMQTMAPRPKGGPKK